MLRGPADVALFWLALALLACGADERAAGVSVGPGNDPRPRDAGSFEDASTSLRPADGPALPTADDEVEVRFQSDPVTVLLALDADLGALDVHLSIDTSQSIAGEIDTLQRDLESRIIPGLEDRVADVAFGVSHFEDFPALPYGFPGQDSRRPDTPFELLTPITVSVATVSSAVASLDQPLGFGGDIPESGAEALFQIATGRGYRLDDNQIITPFGGSRTSGPTPGGVGFRGGALPVVLHVTDARSHEPAEYFDVFPGTHTVEEAAEALATIGAQLVGIVTRPCDESDPNCNNAFARQARDELERIAYETGAVDAPDTDGRCPHGIDGTPIASYRDSCPFVFDVEEDGSGLTETVVDAIVGLVDRIRFERVVALASQDPLGFVEHIVPVELSQPPGVRQPAVADLLPEDAPDGVTDGFLDVPSRARLGFEIQLRNARIAPMDAPQSFRVKVRVLGDDLLIQEHTLRVVVPTGSPPVRDPVVGAGGGDPADDAGAE